MPIDTIVAGASSSSFSSQSPSCSRHTLSCSCRCSPHALNCRTAQLPCHSDGSSCRGHTPRGSVAISCRPISEVHRWPLTAASLLLAISFVLALQGYRDRGGCANGEQRLGMSLRKVSLVWVSNSSHVPAYYVPPPVEMWNWGSRNIDSFETVNGMEGFPCVDPSKVKPECSRMDSIM
jgi:hypothetical protein